MTQEKQKKALHEAHSAVAVLETFIKFAPVDESCSDDLKELYAASKRKLEVLKQALENLEQIQAS